MLIFFIYSCFLLFNLENVTISGLEFERPELISGELRFTNGRVFNNESELARLVLDDPTLYWNKLNHELKEYYEKKSKRIKSHWSQTVTQNERLQNYVSKECLGVLEYMIENPVKEEWSAKSKFCIL